MRSRVKACLSEEKERLFTPCLASIVFQKLNYVVYEFCPTTKNDKRFSRVLSRVLGALQKY